MTTALQQAPSTAELVEFLQPAIADQLGASIESLARAPSRYSTSFAMENLEVTLNDGSRLGLVFKDLSPEALLDGARRTRPGFAYLARREVDVYRRVLSPAGMGTAHPFAAEADPGAGRYWLFLEKVEGVELYQVQDLEIWKAAARWLSFLHERFASVEVPASVAGYDAGWYRRWMGRALEFSPEGTAAALERLVPAHEATVEHLSALPATLIHGDFYASNVLTGWTGSGLRVCPVDWERAAIGPGMLDLASLCAGWDDRPAAE
ncbi:MAG TPA: phosphotransferase, partial [Actinomycetota bacterium]|nr:phosphotransferase [Actinomycetota bacterium]